jgi:DNA-binding transcriptional regulator YiaG
LRRRSQQNVANGLPLKHGRSEVGDERGLAREFHVDALSIKELRLKIGLSQPKFAALLQVDVGTLRN